MWRPRRESGRPERGRLTAERTCATRIAQAALAESPGDFPICAGLTREISRGWSGLPRQLYNFDHLSPIEALQNPNCEQRAETVINIRRWGLPFKQASPCGPG